jgi:DNA-binding transcriptional regulator YdaS (Cro superfamily)
MKLSRYMDTFGYSNPNMVELLRKQGVNVNHSYISRLKHGQRTPSLRVALAIEDATKGRVTPYDWS